MVIYFIFFEPMTAPSPTAKAANVAVGILHGNIGGSHPQFTCRTDSEYGDVVPAFFRHRFHDFIIPFADKLCVFLDRDAVLIDMKGVPGVLLRHAFHDEGFDKQSGKILGGSTSRRYSL